MLDPLKKKEASPGGLNLYRNLNNSFFSEGTEMEFSIYPGGNYPAKHTNMIKKHFIISPKISYHFFFLGRWTSKKKAERCKENINDSNDCHEPWKSNCLGNCTTRRRTFRKEWVRQSTIQASCRGKRTSS